MTTKTVRVLFSRGRGVESTEFKSWAEAKKAIENNTSVDVIAVEEVRYHTQDEVWKRWGWKT